MAEHFKNFDDWNIKKKATDAKQSKPPLFKERDVWWLSVGVNVGFEEDGKNGNYVRPVLIVRKFNRELFLGLPMSTKLKENPYYYSVTLQGKKVSTLISQLRVFSSKRIWNKIGELDTKDYENVMNYLRELVFLPLSPKGKSRG
ncbi:MAG: type II toxin-antitoxin system PemK/MazF family toxin [bacterium]